MNDGGGEGRDEEVGGCVGMLVFGIGGGGGDGGVRG